MPSGGFVGFDPNSTGSGDAGANSIYLTQVTASQNGTATAVLIDKAGAQSGVSFKALVYDGSHSALLATGSAVTSLVAGYNRLPLTASLSLTAGSSYYVGYVCANSLNITIGGGGAAWFVGGGQSVASPANPLVGGSSQPNTLMIALELDGTASPGFGFSPDQASGVTLSTSNTVATFSNVSNLGARGILTHISGDGKFYAEVVAGGGLHSQLGIGIVGVAWGLTQATLTLWVYQYLLMQTGSIIGGASLGLSFVSGDVIGIAYDGINNLLWWNKNNGSWFGTSTTAGNPTTGTGGLAVQASWPMALTMATGGAAVPIFTLRDTSGALQYTPPSGFSAWSPATFPAVASSQARALVLA